MENVSVILPTRNNEDHIADLLDSVFSQSFEGEIEVLVMDSSDNWILVPFPMISRCQYLIDQE